MPNFLSLAEVAKKLHTSVTAVKKMIKDKRLEAVPINAMTTVVDEDALTRIKPLVKKASPNTTKGLEAIKAYQASKKAEKEKPAKKSASKPPAKNGKAEQEPVAAQ